MIGDWLSQSGISPGDRLSRQLQHDCNSCSVILWGNSDCQFATTKSCPVSEKIMEISAMDRPFFFFN